MLKADHLVVHQGDVLVIEAPCGGGYGNPLERNVDSVRDDVLDGMVSLESARHDYGVVFSDGGRVVDFAATSELRAQMFNAYELRSGELHDINRKSYTLDDDNVGH